jgi:hypothetical protein
LDLGLLWSFGKRYALGLSVLHVTRPKFSALGGSVDRAPAVIKIGFAEHIGGFLMTTQLSRREASGGRPGSGDIAAGLERWWATPRSGSFAFRGGLDVGGPDKTAGWGLGWRLFGGEFSYGMTVPFKRHSPMGHAANLVFRFGASNPDGEYEKILAEERVYRRQLAREIEDRESREKRLAETLERLRGQIEVLHKQLSDRAVSDENSRKQARGQILKLEEQSREASSRYEDLAAENKKLSRKTQEMVFEDDWNAYLRLKIGGAPNSVLIEEARRILRQYKDEGVDLGAANAELVRLLRSQ